MAVIIIECEGSNSVRVELSPGQYSLGAAPDNAIVVDHVSISRHHCALQVHRDGRIVVQDMGSTNGIWINARKITEGTVVPGECFHAGMVKITVEGVTIPVPRRISEESSQSRSVDTSISLRKSEWQTERYIPQTFWQELPGAFMYPLKDEGYLYIIIVVGIGILETLLPNAFGLVSMLVGIILGCYLVIIWEQIVLSAVEGKDSFPNFPHTSFNWQEYLSHYLRYVALIWICFAPAFLYRAWFYSTEHTIPWLLPVLYGISCLYFPMALLAFVINDSFAVLSPPFIIQSITRAFKDYLLLAGMLAFMVVGETLLFKVIEPAMHPDVSSSKRFLFQVISIGSGAISLYLVFVWLRLLGLFHRHNADQLAWSI